MMIKPVLTGVIVTGGASGIGLASAQMLAEAGRPVAIWDLSEEKSQAIAADIQQRYGVVTIGLGVDVGDSAAISQAVEQSRAALPSIGGLVHAAGVVMATGLEGVTEDNWALVMDVNLRAQVIIARDLLEDFKANPGSAVVGIASINGTLGNKLIPAYTASKGGLIALTRSLSDELGQYGIRVNTLSPGMIATPMLTGSAPVEPEEHERNLVERIHLNRVGEPVEVGRAVRFLMSAEASYITGAELVVDGGNIPSQR